MRKDCLKTIQVFLVFCLSGLVLPVQTQARSCRSLYTSITSVDVDVRPIQLDVSVSNKDFYIDRNRVRHIATKGREHWYIFAAQEAGVSYIYKIINGDSQKQDAVVGAVKLGASVGGPKLHGSGTVVLGQNLRRRGDTFYLKIEMLFPSEVSYNIKDHGIVESESSPTRMLDEIASAFVNFARKGIVPKDPDVMYTADYRWRWIDPDNWYQGDPKRVAYEVKQLLLSYLSSEHARLLAKLVIEKGKTLPPEVLSAFKTELAYYLRTP